MKWLAENAGTLLLGTLVLGLIFVGLFVRPDPDTRLCDIQCNTAQCACVRTCPSHRN
jgi:hypothetical protein